MNSEANLNTLSSFLETTLLNVLQLDILLGESSSMLLVRKNKFPTLLYLAHQKTIIVDVAIAVKQLLKLQKIQ